MKNILLELILCQKIGAALLLEKKLQKQFCMFKFRKFEKNATVPWKQPLQGNTLWWLPVEQGVSTLQKVKQLS
jgi:hypothetical protein